MSPSLAPPGDVRSAVLERIGAPADAATALRLPRPRLRGGVVELPYEIDGVGSFVETFSFDGLDVEAAARDDEAVHRAVWLLHAIAGVSYYKTVLPRRLEFEDPAGFTDPVAELLTRVYTAGLGEFAYRNGIRLEPTVVFSPQPLPAAAAPDERPGPVGARPLVPVGGGKDSIVTLEAVRRIAEPTLFAINPRGPIVRTIETSQLPAITAQRELSEELFALNAQGALNGHVPVTAIVSAAAVVAAVVAGHDAVVMSNEGSADTGNTIVDGVPVNHQWSKSSAFEAPFADVLRTEVDPELTYFSFLRDASELAIARAFSGLTRYHGVFNSCNRAFHLRGERTEWCGECPKCRFVFLALAPFLRRDEVIAILGRDLLDDPSAREEFRALIGDTGVKPWECVGELEESRAAMDCLASRPEWSGSALVRELGDPEAGCRELEERAATPTSVTLPAPYDEALRAAL